MLIKQISVFVENKTGRLAEITDIIGKANIDIRALSIADTSDFGILRIIVDNPVLAEEKLRKANLTVAITDVIAIGVDDTPGSFAKAMNVLSEENICVEYMYAFISQTAGKAFVIMRTNDIDKAIKVLQDNNITMITDKEIYNM